VPEGRSASRKPELLEHERLIELLPAFVHLPADHLVDHEANLQDAAPRLDKIGARLTSSSR